MNRGNFQAVISSLLIYILFISNLAIASGGTFLDNPNSTLDEEVVGNLTQVSDLVNSSFVEEENISVEVKANLTDENISLENDSFVDEINITKENIINITEENISIFNESNVTLEENISLGENDLIIQENNSKEEEITQEPEAILEKQVYPEEDFEIELTQLPAKVGEPVRWVKRVYSGDKEVNVKIPDYAKRVEKSDKKSFSLISLEPEVKDYVEVLYETPSPKIEEKKIAKDKKEVFVSSDYHYFNITANTTIDFNLSVNESSKLNVYWKEENKFLNFNSIDSNNDGFIDSIEWLIPHLSDQTFEIYVDVLTVQSYPVVGGTWKVEFQTEGVSNLSITGINGTCFGEDLEFLELKCGENEISYIKKENGIFVENYSCFETSSEVSRVLSTGKHDLEFKFGDSVDYAHNFAGKVGYRVQSGVYNFAGLDEFIPLDFAVNISNAFVIAPNMMHQENTTAGTNGDPVTHTDDSFVSLYLYNSTHIRAQRSASDDGSVVVTWQVLEAMDSEFTVQRGGFTYSGTSVTINATLPTSVNKDNSMSWFYINTTYAADRGDVIQFYSDLIDNNTIQFTREDNAVSTAITFRWVVVEWNTNKINGFYKGYTGAITGAYSSPDCYNIGTFNKSSSFLFHHSHAIDDSDGGLDSSTRGGYIQDDNTICFYDYDGIYSAGVKWYLIDFIGTTQREDDSNTFWGTTDYVDDVTFSGSYNKNQTLSFVSGTCNGDGLALPRHTQWYYLTGTPVIGLHIERTYGGQDREYAWQVLELPYFENIDSPQFSNPSVNQSVVGLNKNVRFSVDVTDASNSIDSVIGNIDGNNQTFNSGSGDSWYYDWTCTSSNSYVDFSSIFATDDGYPINYNSTTISSVSTICDTINPIINFVSPDTPLTGAYSGENYFFINTSVTETNFKNITYELYNSTNLLNKTSYSSFVDSIVFTNLGSGDYFYNVTVFDLGDQEGHTETRTIHIDSENPLVEFSGLTKSSGEVVSGSSIGVEVSVIEENEANITFDLFNSTGTNVRTNSFTDGRRSVTWTLLPDGIYYYNVTVYDTYSHKNSTETRNITIDNVFPVISYITPTEQNNSFFNRSWIYVNTSVVETYFKNITFELYNSTSLINTTTYTNNNREINWTGLTDGVYYYNVTVYDLALNKNFTLTRKLTLDSVKPILDFGIGTENNDTNFKRTWIYINSSIVEDYFQNITFNLYTSTDLVNQTTFSDATRQINFTNLGSEVYYYNITVYDKAGNFNSSLTRKIGLDTLGPTIIIISPQAKAYGNGTGMLLNYTVTDNIVGVDSCWYRLDTGINTTVSCTGTANFDATDGAHILYFYSNDTFSNLGQSQVTFSVSTTGPAIVLDEPDNDTIYSYVPDVFFNYSTEDPDGVDSCSLYGSWNGAWHKNQTDFSFGLLSNSSDRTCTQIWGFDCGAGPAESGDNTWDTCANGAGNDESVENIYLSDTQVTFGKQITVTCEYDPYTSSDDTHIWYYNGTGWRILQEHLNWGASTFTNESISFTPDNVVGTHWVRCGINYYTDSDGDYCAEGTTLNYYDNDDINFTVVAPKTEGNFTVNVSSEGNFVWNVLCNDSLSYVTSALSNYTVGVDLTNPIVDFGVGTQTDGKRISASSIYVNVSIVETNLGNVTFDLFNSTSFKIQNVTYTNGIKNHTFSSLDDGIYYYNITVYDKAGRLGTSSTRSIELDTIKPSGSNNNPADELYTNNLTQNFTATVSDNIELKDAMLFIFNSTGNLVYSSLVDLVGLTTATIGVVYTFLYDDVFSWFYRVRDSVDNEYNTTSYNLNLDITEPVITFVSPTQNNASIVLADHIFVNVSIYEENYKNITFNLYDSTLLKYSNSFSDNTREINWTLLSSGVYYYNVTSYDLADNVGYSETRQIILDYENPIVSFSGITKENNSYINGSSISLEVNVTEPNEDSITFDLYNATGYKVRTNTYYDKRRTVTWTLLSDGVYYYNATVVDKVGLIGSTQTRKLTIDNVNPLIIYSTGTEINNSNKSQSWVFVNTSVTEINFKNITFDLYNSSGLVRNQTFTNSSRSYNFTNLIDGTYYYNVTTYDLSLNKNSTSTRKINLDTTKPFVSFSTGTKSNGTITNEDWIYINVTASDLNFKEVKFDLYEEGELINETIFTDSTREINFTGLNDGNFKYNVTAIDFSGNFNSTETRDIGLDSIGPIINIVNPRTKTYGYNTSLPLDYVVYDTVSSVHTCIWNLDSLTNQTINCATNTTFNASEGEHMIYFYANDSFGNWNVVTKSFSVSVTGPAIELVKPLNNSFYSTASEINFSFAANDPDDVDTCSIYGDWNLGWHENETYSGNWFLLGFKHRKEISITNVGGTTLTDFPIYLNISSEYTDTGDYYDLRFFNGSCETHNSNLLSYEIEDYDSTNANVWVKIPSLVSGVNKICMYYGNDNAENMEDTTGVWSSSYTSVYHLDHTSGTAIDSVGNFNAEDFINPDSNMNTLGVVGKGDYFDGDDYLGTNPEWNVDGAHTYCTWTKISTGHDGTILEDGGLTDGSGMGITSAGNFRYAECYNGVFNPLDSPATYVDDSWHYICGGHTGTVQFLYVDGVLVNSATQGDGLSGTDDARIGSANNANPLFNDNLAHAFIGTLDELEVSSISRSSDWINQSYQQIENYNTVISFGVENNFTAFTIPFSQEGTYKWNVKCNDTIGYDSFAFSNYSFIIDVTSPQVFFGSTTAENDSDVGRSWIYVDTVIIENNFKNVTFNLYNSTSLVKTNTFTDSTRNVNWTSLSSGIYFYNITSYDLAEHVGYSETREINLDLTPPTGELLTPTDNSYVKSLVQNLTASFNDATGLLNATLFVFNSTGNLVYTNFVELGGVISATIGIVYNFLEEGIYSWFYRVEDVVNNKFDTDNNTLTVDITKPLIDYSFGVEDSGSIFERENIYVNVTTNDLYFSNLTFDLYDSLGLKYSNTFSDGTTEINWTSLTDGTYYYNVTASDIAGNTNSTETRNLTLDNLFPVISFGAGTKVNGEIISGDTIFVDSIVTEANEANITFNLYNSTGYRIRTNTFTDRTRSVSWNLLNEGTYYYNITVVDLVSHSTSTSTRSITLDNTYPQISYVSPTLGNNSYVKNNFVDVKVNIVETNFKNVTFELYNTTALVNRTTYTNTNREVNWTNLANGIYYYNVTTYDVAGNKNSTLTRKITIDNVNPIISYSTGTEINYFNKTDNWVFVNVSLSEINFANITFSIYNLFEIVNETTFTDTTRQINFTNLASDNYWYNVTAYDLAGNVNYTETRKIGLDYLGPTIQILNPKAKAYGYNVSLPLSYSVTDNIIGVDSCWYQIDSGTNTTVDCSSSTTFDTSDGQHTLHFYSNDSFGNLGYSNVTFLVSTTGPAIQLIEPEDNSFYAQSTEVLFNYTAEDPDGVDTCSLYGSWNGGWHLNVSESGFLVLDDTDVTCNIFWGQDCSLDTTTEFDNTFDDCSTKANTDEMVRSMTLNATTVAPGDVLNITCSFDLWNTDNVYFWYYNGTGWKKIYEVLNTQVGTVSDYYYSTTFVADDVIGDHVVRCGLNYNDDTETDSCTDGSGYYDNDDINFTVAEPKEPSGFFVNLSEEGTSEWNIKCNDTKSYDSWGAENFSITVDVTNPVALFGVGTLQNDSNVSQNFIYVNSTIVENNFKNMTFRLYNSSSVVKSSFYNDTTRSVNWTNLVDGKYYYNITVYDQANRVGYSETRFILLDTKNPEGTLVDPRSSIYTNEATQNFTATVSDENGLKDAILFILNSTGQAIYTDTISLVGLFSATIGIVYTFLEDGIFDWFYQVEDSVGNKVNVTSNELIVDTTKPVIEFISSTLPTDTFITNNFIYANTSVVETNFRNITFDLYKGSLVLYSNSFTNSKRDINWTLLSDGVYYYNVTVYDLADNVNYSETRNITLDNILPTISYSTGTEINNSNKSQSWVYVNTTFFDVNFNNVTYSLYNSSGLVNSTTYLTEIKNINWTNFSLEQEGEYYYNVTVYDKAGLKSTLPTRKITLDTTLPLVSLVPATSPSGTVAERSFIFLETALTETNFKNITYQLYNSTNLVNSTTYTTYVPSINFTANSENRTYYYNVTVYDAAGNKGNTLTRNITLIDVTKPYLNLISPLNKTYSYNKSLRLSYDVFDVHLDKCWYNLNGGVNVSLPNCEDTTLNVADEQSHTIYLFANDTLGYLSSSNVTFFVNSSLIETPTYQVVRGQALVDGYVEANVNEIDPSKAFILHSTRGGDNGPDSLQVISDFIDVNTISFENYISGETVVSEWAVVVGPNISVERGEVDYTNEKTLNVNINSVNLSNSFLIVNNKLNSTDSSKNVEGFWVGEFVDSDNLRFNRSSNSSGGILSWQVVSWKDVFVTSGELKINNGAIVNTTTIPNVDLNKSFLIFSKEINGSQNIEDSFVEGKFLDSNTLSFSRVGNTGEVTLSYFVVSSDLFSVQSGEYNNLLNTLEQSIELNKDLINSSRGFSLKTNNNTGATTSYSTAYSTNKIYDNNTIYLQKGSSLGSGTNAWFSVEIKDLNKPNLTLVSPTDYYNYSTYLIPSFNYSVSDENDISNCSLYGNWSTGWHLNQTVYGNYNFTSVNVSNSGFYKWGVVCYDIYGNSAGSLNYTFSAYLPTTEPVLVNITQTANDGTGDVFFDWADSVDAVSYRIYSGENATSFTLLDEVINSNYTDTTFSGNKRRFYKVEAWNPSSSNMSEEIIGAHVYTLKHNPSGIYSIKDRNWIGFPTNFSDLKNANDTLNEVTGITSITKFDSLTQKRVTCDEFSCPESFSCTETACNFDISPGEGYEVELNESGPAEINWSSVGKVYTPQDITLLYDETLTKTNKHWISMYAGTVLKNTTQLAESIDGEDTITRWNSEEQISEGLIPNPFPWINVSYLGGAQIEMEEGYEISIVKDTVWRQE
ncbi:hypothetical protein GW932_02415 [archaeon]|nr:hypothetical protein [archaeon]